MDVDSSQRRMAAYMRDHQDKVVGRWSELVVASLRGRSSAAEVRRELEDLYSLVVRTMTGADEQAAGELRAVLTELSGSRARNGFTPRETALGVFALKDAVFEVVADAADLAPEYLAFSRMIDDLGLLIFETYAAAREQIIADQAAAMLELSTPVIRLWDGVIAVPLVGTLDSARTQLVMEKLLDTLVATGADHVVLDITGVPTVGTEVALLDPASGELQIVNCGHMPLLLVQGGTATYCGEGGLLLGLPMHEPHVETTILPEGGIVLLMTDGLVEDRGVFLDVNLEKLRVAAQEVSGADVEAFSNHLMSIFGPREDDVAMIALRRTAVIG